MKKLVFSLLLIILFSGSTAQACLLEGFTFTTQTEIDNFQVNYPGCTIIEGSVTIFGNNITNLVGLNVLTSIVGNFELKNTCALTDLIGLDNLTSIGGYLMFSNTCLVNMSGLNNLVSVDSTVFFKDNYLLTSLNGLESLNSIGGDLYLSSNPLINLTGLNNLAQIGGNLVIGNFYWGGNNSLTSLAGLESLTSIIGGLSISSNYNLTNLTALANLYSIGTYLSIGFNNSLTNLSGLEGLISIGGSLSISQNDTLTDISGLANINSGSINNLYITNNDLLSTCHIKSICEFLAAPQGTVIIEYNAEGCKTEAQIKAACETTGLNGEICEDLFSVIPNPILENATINFKLPNSLDVKIEILNLVGKAVMMITDEKYNSGIHQVNLNTCNLPTGLYFCRLQYKSSEKIIKIVIQ